MPTTSDFSDALLRRTIILSFDRKFEGAERDVYLKEKLDQELSGIFNMALSAYGEALKRGEFTYCPSSEEAKGRWQLECDQVALFVLECCELAPGIKSTSKVIYDAYKKWTHEMGYKKTVYRVRFTRRLGKFGVTPDKGTKGMRLLIGIRLKNFQVA